MLFVIILLFSFIYKIEAFDHSHNDACYEFEGGVAATGCNPQSTVSNTSNSPKLYVVNCLSCTGWKTAYDGCGAIQESEFDSGWREEAYSTWHEQCKQPIVAYRTWKGTLSIDWNRCDKIKDETDTQCDIIEGDACATCTKCCDTYECSCGENCTTTCCGRDYGYKCTGVSADGTKQP